ncbi:hypothetical protein PTSG_05656 [Salpingoeca rosetta]|uniref:N-acylethanolamine-hydrolyzing acid amidase n=1 Tax=Salpingoeca rosetta (strain ATCC 50818 / BSB-021) TaxID=946362 RepID=F2UBU6_SALR5|nr:uncharacterized protein PTSG_05656 [Salpingoeca rosetta]EGD73962.1 hypothetical protein PTSG_05656 [Salpingoeca rosetta]|eukprot:XP_004993525.1 hypothetical protein PTSG_05656 [Salpingoeca rosetta]
MRFGAVFVAAIVAVTVAVAVPSTATDDSVVIKNPKPANGTTKDVPHYVVDLSKPPKERWAHIVKNYKPEMQDLIRYMKKLLSPKVFDDITVLLGDLDNALGQPWADEMRGAADALDVDVGDVVLANLYYEADTACTSIVAQRSNGTIFHGRNLDFNLPDLQQTTVEVSFQHGEQGPTLYRATTYAGYVGILTGMRPDGFSVSLDERWTKNGTLWDNLLDALKGYHPVGFVLRTALEEQKTFDQAVQYLSTVKLITVSYIIVGGVRANEGAVITRERESAIDVWRIAYPNRWFLVETNYDHWKPVPASDDRRDPANKHMHATNSSAITPDVMWSVMNMFPNLNSETTYTVVMSADTHYFKCKTQNNKP